MVNMAVFQRYIGIDYSGAQTPTSSLKGLRVYMAGRDNLPEEVQSPPSPGPWSYKSAIQHAIVHR